MRRMTRYLAWKKHLGGSVWFVWLLCSAAAVGCGELRLPDITDATPAPPLPADAAPRADAALSDGGPVDARTDAGPPDAAPPCVIDGDLGSGLGLPVFQGNTSGFSDEFLSPACGDTEAGDAPEIYLTWTAPAAGLYQFDTCGSEFDTILSVLEDSCGDELDCLDDLDVDEMDPCFLDSVVELTLQQGERVILVVDGYEAGDDGNFVLNITQKT